MQLPYQQPQYPNTSPAKSPRPLAPTQAAYNINHDATTEQAYFNPYLNNPYELRPPPPPSRANWKRRSLLLICALSLITSIVLGYLYVNTLTKPETTVPAKLVTVGVTPTHLVQATPTYEVTTVTPTVAPSPTPTTPPLFSDSFQDNNNAWDLTSIAGKYSVKIGGGSLVLEDDDNKLLWELIPGTKVYSDFKLVVDATFSQGDQSNGYGVFIRGASNQNNELATYYRFELYGDGTYAVFKGVVDAIGNSQSNTLVDYTSDPAIQKQGGVNHIAIIANGPRMTLMVNGQSLTTITDNSYNSGSIALFVSNLPAPTPPGAQATFNNLAIYPVSK